MVVPEGHDEDVAASKRGTHLVKTTESLERRCVTEGGLLLVTVLLSDGVAADALNGRVGVLEDGSSLDVETLDLGEAGAGADELSDDSHLLGGVEGHAWAVEVTDAHAVAVEVAAVLIADSAVAVVAVTAADVVGALLETSALAGVGSVGSGDGVGLPDVHLGAAGADVTLTGVGVVLSAVPARNVSLTVDPLDVVGALSVAVSWNLLEAGKGSE